MCEDRPNLLTQKQVADRLQVSERTLERWRSEHQGPPFVQLVKGGKVRYRAGDVGAWLETQLVRPVRSNVCIDGSDRLYAVWSSKKK